MPNPLRISCVCLLGCLFASCATPVVPIKSPAFGGRIEKVRTTAYTHSEGSGGRNALGRRLSGQRIKSAASDWSRFPLGTHFRVAGTNEEFMIDDYGGALIGTNTIDLYKPSHGAMRKWGVRRVDIEILQWGSDEQSLKVLQPRRRVRIVRRMIAGLQNKKT